MPNNLKVGQSCEVITITKRDYDDLLYKPGDTGVILKAYRTGNLDACIGTYSGDDGQGWFVRSGRYRKVGKLTVTKIK